MIFTSSFYGKLVMSYSCWDVWYFYIFNSKKQEHREIPLSVSINYDYEEARHSFKRELDRCLGDMVGQFVHVECKKIFSHYHRLNGYLYKDDDGWYGICRLIPPKETKGNEGFYPDFLTAFSYGENVYLKDASNHEIQQMKQSVSRGLSKFSGNPPISIAAKKALLSY
jgi:hypothetical protein